MTIKDDQSWTKKLYNLTVSKYIKFLNLKYIMMMMNCFCGMVDRRKTFSLISSRDHCQRSSPSRISDTPSRAWACAEPEFRLSWMKLCSSDNHYTTAPQVFVSLYVPYIFTVLFLFFVLLFIFKSSPCLPASLKKVPDFLKVWVLFCTYILEFWIFVCWIVSPCKFEV